MAGGSKRLPRAVREQQMLDAAVGVFAAKGFHETSMDAIAVAAAISKPMLYLYYGSKDELFAACIQRESARFLESVSAVGDPRLSPREQVHTALVSFLDYVDTHRDSWSVVVRTASGQPAFAKQVDSARERLIDMVAHLLELGTRTPVPGSNFHIMAVALIGAGEAVADRIVRGDVDVQEAASLLESLAWRGLSGKRTAGRA